MIFVNVEIPLEKKHQPSQEEFYIHSHSIYIDDEGKKKPHILNRGFSYVVGTINFH